MRILMAKAKLGLASKKLVDLEEIHSVVDSVGSNAVAQQIADRSVTLVKNDHDAIPLAAANQACLVVVTERRISQYGQRMASEFHRRAPGARVAMVDPSMAAANVRLLEIFVDARQYGMARQHYRDALAIARQDRPALVHQDPIGLGARDPVADRAGPERR